MSHDQLPKQVQDSSTAELKAKLAADSAIPPKGERDKRHRNMGHLPVALGGGALAIAIAAGGMMGLKAMNSENDSSSSPREPGVSAPANPGEEAPVESIEAVVGQPGSTFENISVRPTQEMIDQALQPVTIADFPTPEAALEQFGRIDNILQLSGSVDTTSIPAYPQTPESVQLQEDIFRNMLTDNGYDSINNDTELPRAVAVQLWIVNDSNSTSTGGETGTWHVDWTPENVQEVRDGVYNADVLLTTTTNFHHFNEYASQVINDIQDTANTPAEMTLVQQDGTWKLDSWTNVG